jgi:hypothetical protein
LSLENIVKVTDVFGEWSQILAGLEKNGGFWVTEEEVTQPEFDFRNLKEALGASLLLDEQLVIRGAVKNLILLKHVQQPIQTLPVLHLDSILQFLIF